MAQVKFTERVPANDNGMPDDRQADLFPEPPYVERHSDRSGTIDRVAALDYGTESLSRHVLEYGFNFDGIC